MEQQTTTALTRETFTMPRLDVAGAVRDTFVAGGFTAAIFGAGARSWSMAAQGAAMGGSTGFLLHLVPHDFYRHEPRGPRLMARMITGGLAGLVLGTATYALTQDEVPSSADLAAAAVRSFLAGAGTYAVWGAVEPHSN